MKLTSLSLLLSLIVFMLLSCKKNDDNANPYYFKGTINGQQVKWEAPFVSYSTTATSQFRYSILDLGGNMPLFNCMQNDSTYQDRMGMSVYENHDGQYHNYANSIDVYYAYSNTHFWGFEEVMRSWFTTGPKTYGIYRQVCSDPILNGVIINYTDANNINWINSGGDQSTNTFELVTLQKPAHGELANKEWIIRFSAKLYDNQGHSIQLSNCEMYGPIWSY